jgi:hypothetical protein
VNHAKSFDSRRSSPVAPALGGVAERPLLCVYDVIQFVSALAATRANEISCGLNWGSATRSEKIPG